MDIMLGIIPKNPYVLLKYLRGLHIHIHKYVMFFKPRKVDEVCVQEQYLENIRQNKWKPNSSNKKEHREASKEGKKKWKVGEDKKTTTTTH
jgi:hypothetical protein